MTVSGRDIRRYSCYVRRELLDQKEERVGLAEIGHEATEHVEAQVAGYSCERCRLGGGRDGGEWRVAQEALEDLLSEREPRAHASDEIAPQLRFGEAGANKLGNDGDVSALNVLAEEVGRAADELVGSARIRDSHSVASEPLGARPIEGCQEEFVDSAEMVEDERRIEPTADRNGTGTRAGITLLDQCLQRRVDHPCSGANTLLGASARPPGTVLDHTIKFIV